MGIAWLIRGARAPSCEGYEWRVTVLSNCQSMDILWMVSEGKAKYNGGIVHSDNRSCQALEIGSDALPPLCDTLGTRQGRTGSPPNGSAGNWGLLVWPCCDGHHKWSHSVLCDRGHHTSEVTLYSVTEATTRVKSEGILWPRLPTKWNELNRALGHLCAHIG